MSQPKPDGLPPLITALLNPSAYPHPVQQVQCVQTHISWVLLAGAFAYKIKKPVKLPFLDYSTLALRQHNCQEELRLNQRFAPDVYLQVLPITATPEQPQWGGPGPVLDYAVQMRRFDDQQRLDRLCQRGELTAQHMRDLAHALVQFHEHADRACQTSEAAAYGTPAQALAPCLDNLAILARALPQPDVQQQLHALRQWTTQQAQSLNLTLQARRDQGWVRECHGDLHLGNLVLLDGRVRLFDCIEFSPTLRWIDVASELAFTAMDLLHQGQGGLANVLVNEVLSANGDYACAPLLRFYAVYRSLVRAKVAAIRSGQPGTDATALQEALAYLSRAEGLAHPPAPQLVITHGLSGSGKSVAAQRWLESDASGNTVRLRSDVERKRLFGLAPLQASGSPVDQGIYAPDAHVRTYQRLAELAQGLLQAGWSVVVDAAFLQRAERDEFAALAQRCHAQFRILAPQAPLDVLRQRITQRQAAGQDPSEATLAVLDKQLGWIEPLTPQELARCVLLG